MKKLLLLLAMLPLSALAGSFTATWVHPTTNTDGSALPLAQITSTRVEWGTCVGSAFGTAVGQLVVPAPATTVTATNVAAGTICVHAATTANGNEGGWSVVQQKVILAPTPNPPTLTIAVVSNANVAPAYKILTSGARSEVLAGFVPVGKACSGNVAFYYRGVPFRRVAPVDVQWWGTASTINVAASCG